MTAHDRALELAAAAMDFPMTPAERNELDEHLASCRSCRREVTDLRADAVAVLTPVTPLSAERSQVILAGALRRRRSGPPMRALAVAALFALAGGAAIAVGAQLADDAPTETPPVVVRASESPSPSESPVATADPSTSSPPSPPAEPGGAPTDAPTTPTEPTPSMEPPAPSPGNVAPVVRADARAIGTAIDIAPAPDGSAFVTVPGNDETNLYRLEPDGSISPGWPLILPNAPCEPPLAASDGSVRVVCSGPDEGELFPGPQHAFAFTVAGQPLAGWPVEVPCCSNDLRLVDDRLTLVAAIPRTDVEVAGEPYGMLQVITVEGDGAVRAGSEQPLMPDHMEASLGPDGTAYGLRSTAEGWEVLAFDSQGARAGWPVQLDGWASRPAFLPDGRIAFTVGTPWQGPTRIVFLDRDGQEAGEQAELSMIPPFDCQGACDDPFASPVVGGDVMWLPGEADAGRLVTAVGFDGRELPGSRWESPAGLQYDGFCPEGETGCGHRLVGPTVGPDGEVFVAVEATDTGGAIIAVAPNGSVREGWPVTLTRPGSAFWSLVTAESGVTYALAIEPESDAGFSGTILRLERDSTVSWATTLVEP